MQAFAMLALLQASQDDGLTASEIFSNIPHDPAAIVVYVLVGFSVGLVIWSGRRGTPRRPGITGDPGAPGTPGSDGY